MDRGQTGSREVRGGDYPLRGEEKLAAVTLFSGLTKVSRIKELQRVAIEAQDNIDEIRQDSEENLRELVDEGADELEPLF